MALGKPLFYMLAKHGPWSYHIRVKGMETALEIEKWLVQSGKKLHTDWETLVEAIEHKNTKKTFIPTRVGQPTRKVQSVEPTMFFNELSVATYVKMTWGGR